MINTAVAVACDATPISPGPIILIPKLLMSRKESSRPYGFIIKLGEILQNEDESVIRWSDDLQRVEIHKKRLFTHDILPKYFHHCQFSSFKEQLHYFGFIKHKHEKGCYAFSHQHFTADQQAEWGKITPKTRFTYAHGNQSPETTHIPIGMSIFHYT